LNLNEIQIQWAKNPMIHKLHSKKALKPALNFSKHINLTNFTRMKVCT